MRVFERLDDSAENRAWLADAIRGAIKEYHSVWMSHPRLDPTTGLSRYRPDGLGVPPETEAAHFTHLLEPVATRHGLSIPDFIQAYNAGTIKDAALDEYFLHDRALRESGHDTTYRFERVCADLATVDLNSLLYKYETDIATCIRDLYGGELALKDEFELSSFPFGSEMPYTGRHACTPASNTGEGQHYQASEAAPQTADEWFARAARRKELMDRYLWNEEHNMYLDYNTASKRQIGYESCSTFWAMWAGLPSLERARAMV